ncbi:flagellar motor-associated protein FliL [Aliarcobacter faecis]|uniref:flagellar basal body-associated FliL family protein n=1 Tax=Aliarcobacter faecis TaxID=1564138 RepID=UPI00047A49DC|nr:flagellar basal body-associated FliL family protein [Aliarcobacter faecis]QKF74133.1 flagellar motor-associated protein FliL [Aliarcobacter faecis]
MADDNAEVKNQGSGKGLMIVLIALIFILIIAVAGGFYFLYTQTSNLNNNQNPAQTEQVAAPTNDSGNFKADINDLVLNLTDSRGKEKLMKLSFSIKSSEPTIAAIVEEYKAEIIDVVISQIGARSSEELLTLGGKNLLKDELVNDINGVLNKVPAEKKFAKDSVKTILFTTFVIK